MRCCSKALETEAGSVEEAAAAQSEVTAEFSSRVKSAGPTNGEGGTQTRGDTSAETPEAET